MNRSAAPQSARPRCPRALSSLVALALISAASPGAAQPPPVPEPAPPARVVPPRMVEAAPVMLPDDDPPGRAAGTVVLLVTIGADGSVGDVEVVSSMGAALDGAAVTAARASRYEPASVDGSPRASRVRVAFEIPASADADADADADSDTDSDTDADADANSDAASDTEAEAHADAESGSDSDADAGSDAESGADADADAAFSVLAVGAAPGDELRRSAAAVTVVDTTGDQQRTADLGEVLARAGGGVTVRRSGGLGSDARIAIDGLEGEQVRTFLDGVPLHLVGFPRGPAQVPVDLVERVEIYRGVVPSRFGADALGGAIELVGQRDELGTHARAAYQGGAFGTHRLTLATSFRPDARGAFVAARGFFDTAENDYVVHPEVPEDGTPVRRPVRRFHDAYRGGAAFVDLGVARVRWADRAFVRAFVTRFDQELQNNLVMTVPYGEARFDQSSVGASLVHRLARGAFRVESTGGYTFSRFGFVDPGRCRYDWYGRCVQELRGTGEVGDLPSDRTYDQHAGYLRSTGEVAFGDHQRLRLVLAPTVTTRRGEERRLLPNARIDPLAGERRLATLVVAAEYELSAWQERLEMIAFAKAYLLRSRAEEVLGNAFHARDASRQLPGVGAALRLAASDRWRIKVSYELAARFPTPDEIYGDLVLVQPSYGLEPEQSHNANAAIGFESGDTRAGVLRAEVVAFARAARNLIVLIGRDRNLRYLNALRANGYGGEASLHWESPGEWVALSGNVSYQDLRNASSGGDFGTTNGDRIPNRPWLYGALDARLAWRGVTRPEDSIAAHFTSRYVHPFFRSWESLGDEARKDVTPAQLSHGLALTYESPGEPLDVSVTLEIHNLTNARVYDFYGVERPGRAVHAKLILRL